MPRWSRDGRELLFLSLDARIMVADYTAKSDSFAPGKPRMWPASRILDAGDYSNYDLAPDGQRLAAMVADGTVTGGMAVKAASIQAALDGGVAACHVLDGRTPHGAIAELFTDTGVGTIVRP